MKIQLLKIMLLAIGCIYVNTCVIAQMPGVWKKSTVCKDCSLYERGNLDFCDSEHGMIFGDYYYGHDSLGGIIPITPVYVTDDGGNSWTVNLSLNRTLTTLYSFNYLNPDYATSFDGGRPYYTTNKGLSWSIISNALPNLGYVSGKCFSPSIHYRFGCDYASSRTFYLERSIDSGKFFQIINDTSALVDRRIGSICMLDSIDIWASIYYDSLKTYYFAHTTDGGLNWKYVFPIDTLSDHHFYFDNMVGNADGTIYLLKPKVYDSDRKTILARWDFLYSTDSGATWVGDSSNHGRVAELIPAGGTKLWAFIGYRDHWTGFLQCDTLAYSSDNGTYWFYDTESIKGDSVIKMVWKDSTHGYIVSSVNSEVTFSKFVPNSTGVVSGSSKNIYSSPPFIVTPTITTESIYLRTIEPYRGTISIYDILGKAVLQEDIEVVVGEEKKFSLTQLPSGIYFVRFSGPKNFSPVRIIKD